MNPTHRVHFTDGSSVEVRVRLPHWMAVEKEQSKREVGSIESLLLALHHASGSSENFDAWAEQVDRTEQLDQEAKVDPPPEGQPATTPA